MSDIPSKKTQLIRVLVFSIRCFVVVLGSYMLALAVGLPYPVWAPISAVIVSQERMTETRTTLIRRVIGTICGVAITVVINMLAQPFGIDVGLQAALSVGICAILAYERPNFRTAMVTGPILLLTTPPTDPMILVGIYRGTEVIIGGVVAGLVHALTEKGLEYLKQAEAKPNTPPKVAPEE